jgi:streptogrisin C
MAGVAAAAAAGIAVTAVMMSSSAAINADGSAKGGAVLMAAMQRDLSLTPEQSTARLKKETWASGTESTLRETLGTEFGGAWMSKNTLMVGVTTQAAAEAVREAGATPKLVDQGESELTALKKRLDATTSAASSVTGWYVDPASNSVVVVAQPGGATAAKKLIAEGDVPAGAVRVVTAAGAPKPLADVKGGDAYFINDQFRCSVGFSVVGGFVTAGHCGVPGDTTTTGANNEPQGVVKASVFPGTGDFGFVETNAAQTLQPVVATADGDLPVAGSEEAPIGAAICRTGSTTGTRCGVIQAKNATVNYPEGAVTGLTQTDVCAEGGDSGGSWLSGDQAQGVTSGGSGDCTVGGTTFFQPITEILAVDNLQLITTADANPPATTPPATDPPATDPPATDPPATDPPATDPPATDPPATDPPATEPPAADPPADDCADADATVNSSLKRTGSQQATRGFRSHGGQQHACLSGPEGADFDLSLQKRTDRGWKTVAAADGNTAVEELTFTSRNGGTFRYVISSVQGSGEYSLAIDVP